MRRRMTRIRKKRMLNIDGNDEDEANEEEEIDDWSLERKRIRAETRPRGIARQGA